MALQKIMCFGNGQKGDDPDSKKSREIEKQLREDQKRLAKEVKLLLLGTSPSLQTAHCYLDDMLTNVQEPASQGSRRC